MSKLSFMAFALVAVAFGDGCTNVVTEEPETVISLDPWAKAFQGSASPRAITSGPDGDLFVGGTFRDAIDFGGGELLSEPNGSLFMAHLDAEGGHSFSASTGSADEIRSVAIGPLGDLYVAGSFDGLINFGTGKSEASHAGFLAAFDENEASDYLKIFSGSGQTSVDKVISAANGDVIIAARANDNTDFGGGVAPDALGTSQAVYAAYDRDGKFRWEVRLDGAISNGVTVTVDGDGDVILAGYTYNPVTLGSFSVDRGAFLGKIDDQGKPLWLKAVSASGSDNPPTIHDVATDAAGNILFSGLYFGQLSYGSANLPFASNQNGYLAKADPQGEPVFARAVILYDYAQNLDIAVAGDGGVVMALTSYGDVDFGSGSLGTGQAYDAFLARYSAAGDLTGTAVLDGSGSEYVFDVALDAKGQPVICGIFDSVLDFGKKRLLAGESATMYLARLDF